MLKTPQSGISKATVDRLPLYFRTLRLIESEGTDIVSSEELGRRIAVTPEQIRKDLAAFGAFGKKGIGYDVSELLGNISRILGLNRQWKMAIVGVGHLGWALANYRNFYCIGFRLKALFDNNPATIGQKINGVEVLPMDVMSQVIVERKINIGVIAVPAQGAQHVADQMVSAGIRGIWNFAPVRLDIPDEIVLVSEDLSIGLSSLSFHLARSLPEA